jgi:aspartate/methionine/tyrosine aminotransferase
MAGVFSYQSASSPKENEVMSINNTTPTTVVTKEQLIPTNNYLARRAEIPPSRMFLIKQGLATFKQDQPDRPVYDASQGDGGASLPGVPQPILEEAYKLQSKRGSSYDMPYGTDEFRKAVIEDYWKLNSSAGIGPKNVAATVGGRDGLTKAFDAMLALGHGRIGDMILLTRVPWISYNWGPYGVGANVLLAPGDPADGWAFTPEGIEESAAYARSIDRRIAALIITTPDNPTGNTLSEQRMVQLAKKALSLKIPYVLFDWIYHFITDESPMDLNRFLAYFEVEERKRLIFLDGLTKSLGASNIRNAHLIAEENLIQYIVSRASHAVIPSYFSTAVAVAAYQLGYAEACKTIVEPTNASRKVIKGFLDEHGFNYIIGKGYYAFIEVADWLRRAGWADSEPLGAYLAEEHGVAIVPGAFFSRFGGDWVRFSYATPPDRTLAAATRMLEGLNAL